MTKDQQDAAQAQWDDKTPCEKYGHYCPDCDNSFPSYSQKDDEIKRLNSQLAIALQQLQEQLDEVARLEAYIDKALEEI